MEMFISYLMVWFIMFGFSWWRNPEYTLGERLAIATLSTTFGFASAQLVFTLLGI